MIPANRKLQSRLKSSLFIASVAKKISFINFLTLWKPLTRTSLSIYLNLFDVWSVWSFVLSVGFGYSNSAEKCAISRNFCQKKKYKIYIWFFVTTKISWNCTKFGYPNPSLFEIVLINELSIMGVLNNINQKSKVWLIYWPISTDYCDIHNSTGNLYIF